MICGDLNAVLRLLFIRMKITEMLLTIGIPSFCTVLVFWWQECRQHKVKELEAKTQRDRAFTLIESDMKGINASLESFSQTLSNIAHDVMGIRERLAKLEAQNRLD